MSAAVQQFCDAINGGRAEQLAATLAPDALLHSPISRRATFRGRETIVALYRDAVLPGVDATHDAVIGGEGDIWFVRATGRVGGAPIEEIIVMRLGPDGLIAELTLHGRDFPATAALAAALAPRVAPAGVRRLLARLLTAPLAWLLRRGDPVLIRLAGLR